MFLDVYWMGRFLGVRMFWWLLGCFSFFMVIRDQSAIHDLPQLAHGVIAHGNLVVVFVGVGGGVGVVELVGVRGGWCWCWWRCTSSSVHPAFMISTMCAVPQRESSAMASGVKTMSKGEKGRGEAYGMDGSL